MEQYRKKPVVIEAVQFTEQNKDRVCSWAREFQQNVQPTFDNGSPALIIPTLEGEMLCCIGDFLIREPFPTDWRKLYPCKPDIFEKTYEPATQPSSNTAVDPEALTIADYEDVLADHRRLVREIDFILNGENAAKQASLCDLIGQIKKLKAASTTGAVWVKASERLPNHRDNVIVRGFLNEQGYVDHRFVAFGHKAGSPHVDERMYFEYGSRSFVTNQLEWLDERGTTPSNQSDAVEFLDWVEPTAFMSAKREGWLLKGNAHLDPITSAQLYEQFKNR